MARRIPPRLDGLPRGSVICTQNVAPGLAADRDGHQAVQELTRRLWMDRLPLTDATVAAHPRAEAVLLRWRAEGVHRIRTAFGDFGLDGLT